MIQAPEEKKKNKKTLLRTRTLTHTALLRNIREPLCKYSFYQAFKAFKI